MCEAFYYNQIAMQRPTLTPFHPQPQFQNEITLRPVTPYEPNYGYTPEPVKPLIDPCWVTVRPEENPRSLSYINPIHPTPDPISSLDYVSGLRKNAFDY